MYLGRQVEDNMTDMNVVRRMRKKIKANHNLKEFLQKTESLGEITMSRNIVDLSTPRKWIQKTFAHVM